MKQQLALKISLLALALILGTRVSAFGVDENKAESPKSVPTVTTNTTVVVQSNNTTAVVRGTLVSLGSSNPTQHGVLWSLNPNPEIGGPGVGVSQLGATNATGEFSVDIIGLTSCTKYFVRAYATNATGTGYGNTVEFYADGNAPVITLGAAIVSGSYEINGDANCSALIPNLLPHFSATDNCLASPTKQQSPIFGVSIQGSINPVVLKAIDAQGNFSEVTINVIIKDITPPVPNLAVLPVINSECAITELTPPTATDNCDGSGVEGTHNATLPIIENTTITWTYTDAIGNFTTQTQQVTIQDITAPVITSSHNDIEVEVDVNCNGVMPNLTGSLTATDNCTLPQNLLVSQSPSAGSTISGVTPVTLRVEDEAGNFTEVSFNVNIIDKTPPQITSTHNDVQLIADQDCQGVLPDYTSTLTAVDNCSSSASLTVTQSPEAGFVITEPTRIRLTVQDEAGNTSSVSFNASVVDQTAPTPNTESLPDITAECMVATLPPQRLPITVLG